MLGENITQQSAIKNLMKNLDDSPIVGGWALDSAVYSASHGRFKNTADLISWFKNDCESYSVSGDDYGSKNLKADFLQEYCGINLRNDDTGAITGFDTGGSAVEKTAHSIVPDDNDGNPAGHTIPGITFAYPGFSENIATYRAYRNEYGQQPYAHYTDQMIRKMQQIVGGIQFNWARNALELIEKSYGISLTEAGSLVNRINFNFTYDFDSTLGYTTGSVDRARHSIDITINLRHYLNASGEDGMEPATENRLDRLLAHELVHAVMTANIDSDRNLPHFLKEGLAELVHGADDTRGGDLLKIVDRDNISGRNKAFALAAEEYNSECYEGGYALMHYFAKQSSDYDRVKAGSSWDATNHRVVIDSSFTGTYDFRRLSTNVKQVDASRVTSYINLWASDDQGQRFDAGSGGTWFNSGSKNDVFYGGSGVDTICFHSTDGEDTVYNFESGKDTLYFFDDFYWEKEKVGGDDVTLRHGDGKITLKGAALKKIHIQYSENVSANYVFGREDRSNIYEYETDDNYIGSSKQTDTIIVRQSGVIIDGASPKLKEIDVVNATRTTDGVTVSHMRSVMGGAGNDTMIALDARGSVLSGGRGNDRIYLGTGADRIYFAAGDGHDSVYGFEENKDTLVFYDNGKPEKISATKVDLVLRNGQGTVTLRNGAGKKLLLEDGKGKVQKHWFGFDDQNNTYEYEADINYVGSAKKSDTIIVRKNGATIDGASAKLKEIDVVNATRTTGGVTVSRIRSVMGGTGNDTLIALDARGSVLSGGSGNDRIYLGTGADRVYFASGDGNDSVYGFEANKDVLVLYDNGKPQKVRATKVDLVLRNGQGTVTLRNGAGKRLLLEDGKGQVQKYWFGWDDRNNTYEYEQADNYIGSAQKSDTIIVRQNGVSIDGTSAKLKDIDVVNATHTTGGIAVSHMRSVMGGTGNDTLIALDARGSVLSGGRGNDRIYLGTGADRVYFAAGDGHDSVYGFEENKDTLVLYDNGKPEKISATKVDLVLRNGQGTVTLRNGAGKKLLIEDGKGQVQKYLFGSDDRDNTYEYETRVTYVGSSQRQDTLVVKKTASINLQGGHFRDIDVIDARPSYEAVHLAGARVSYGGWGNDTISSLASSESILDGGAGNDTLAGSAGRDIFRFGMGYGKDRIVGSDKKDLLHLFDITDVNKLAVSAANGVLSLNIRGTDDTVSLSGWSANSLQTVRLANGREYHFARANNGRMTLV